MRNFHAVFIVAAPTEFRVSMHKGSLFSTSLPALTSCLFDGNSKRWLFLVVLVYTSLMISDPEHLFRYLLNICFLWKNIYSILLPIFFNQIVWAFAIELYEFFYASDINSLSDIWLASLFSHSVGCLFILLMVAFAVQKLFSL